MHTAAEFHLAPLHIASLLSSRRSVCVCLWSRSSSSKHWAALKTVAYLIMMSEKLHLNPGTNWIWWWHAFPLSSLAPIFLDSCVPKKAYFHFHFSNTTCILSSASDNSRELDIWTFDNWTLDNWTSGQLIFWQLNFWTTELLENWSLDNWTFGQLIFWTTEHKFKCQKVQLSKRSVV